MRGRRRIKCGVQSSNLCKMALSWEGLLAPPPMIAGKKDREWRRARERCVRARVLELRSSVCGKSWSRESRLQPTGCNGC
jgi:hypothetical protein